MAKLETERVPTAEELDALFRAGTMKRLGIGVRRACYAIPGTDLCVKCYRSEDEIALGKHVGYEPFKPLRSSVISEIRRNRFSDRKNTSCQEWRYFRSTIKRAPKELAEAFPETIERLLVPVRGWCLVESIVRNFDGTPPRRFHEVCASIINDRSLHQDLLSALKSLRDRLVESCIRFYDPQNILVQWTTAESFRLRIVDFEPESRVAIPIDELLPPIARMKIRRRFARYMKMFAPVFS